MKRSLPILFFVLSIFFIAVSDSIAQEDGLDVFVYDSYEPIGEIVPKHTATLMVGLPNALVNKAYNSIMLGVIEINPYYQYFLPNSFAFGVGLQYSHFNINTFRVPEQLSGNMNTMGAFVKLGYEKFYLTRFAIDVSVKVGAVNSSINTNLNGQKLGRPYRNMYGYIAPTIGFILSASERSSYRLTASYAFQGFAFHPSQLGSSVTTSYTPEELSKLSQTLTIAMGYTHYFKKKNTH